MRIAICCAAVAQATGCAYAERLLEDGTMDDTNVAMATQHGDGMSDRVVSATVRLANIAPGALTKQTVEQAFALTLAVLRKSEEAGTTYRGELPGDAGSIEFFRNGDRFALSIVPRGRAWLADDCYDVDRLAATLKATGWTSGTAIAHPFVEDSFEHGARALRVQRAGRCVTRLELLSDAG